VRGIHRSPRIVAFVLAAAAVLGSAQTTPVIDREGVVRGLDNYDASFNPVARGSLFLIRGTNLAPSPADAPGLPLPTTLNSVRVQIIADAGQQWDAPLISVSPSVIEAVVPSAVPEGTQSVVVTVDGAPSAGAPMLIATRQFAAAAVGAFGFGPAIVQQMDSSGAYSLNSFMNPAAPGQAMVLWGNGLGPLPTGAGDAAAPGPVDLSSDVMVYVGNIPVKPFYAGRAPTYPGVDQINFFLPAAAPPGCYVPLTIAIGSVASAPLTLSVGPPGSPCPSELGLSPDQLTGLDRGDTITLAILQYGAMARYGYQPFSAWVADYDAADLSLLVTGWQSPPVQPAPHCERNLREMGPGFIGGLPPNPDLDIVAPAESHVFGRLLQPQTESASWFALAGPGGCSPASDPACIPSSYVFNTLVNGVEVPAIAGSLPPGSSSPAASANFAFQPDGSIAATWNFPGGTPRDQIVLGVGSYTPAIDIFPGQFSASGAATLVCTVPSSSTAYLVSADDAWVATAFQIPEDWVDAAVLSLQAYSTPLVIPVAAPLLPEIQTDLVLVLTGSGISATARLSPPDAAPAAASPRIAHPPPLPPPSLPPRPLPFAPAGNSTPR